ncbi:MerR family transcriptional regulator [Tsukamurella sp. 8F]|uniref:MerR family transcriptional regulator n=1 Tax=unclassified Tsukamurella TaxID=2633480 RepID=UPI0023B92471|nr:MULTISPECIES: MerR family transcriptional regulator [unclassified Tsukamurella]MDF0530602.1 MerR family transcriptional regulator [Tsukamurella sp. 8J]MDF0587803.1 MerR family transcriptional regulator [Tsukamurella sp. 8F]
MSTTGVVRERGLYSISVASELTDVGPQTLRLYERRNLILPARSAGGTRRYSDRDIERIRRIAALVDDGVNLPGVERILALEEECAALRRRLHRERRP